MPDLPDTPETPDSSARNELANNQGALQRLSVKGLRRRGDVRSFFERATRPNSRVEAAAAMDGSMRVAMARATGGLSPISLGLAVADWAGHLVASPGTLSRLTTEGLLAWGQAMQ
ncbi:MAG: poly-beta-hydroxybutyrate polymerase N-terminal domain-containing protein, partial [Polaromonas sp.]|nr:poly-beta-hydroxybutyrate polymerase N-terminal domain-containing protein [Polaromonas sp.]